MINKTLYLHEMKKSIKLLLILGIVLTFYMVVIIGMYDPKMLDMLNQFYEMMPELMASMGMKTGTSNLLGFMISYLYGFIVLVFPMVFCIVRGNGLVAKYIDDGSMALLLSAPVKRKTIILTQLATLLSGILILVSYSTIVELIVANIKFPGELDISKLLLLNLFLLCLHLFIAGICFLSSCIFSEFKNSLAFGAGIPCVMFVLQMLANVGEKSEFVKYFTFFTLFDPYEIIKYSVLAIIGPLVLFIGSVVMFISGCVIFCKKDICV